ncbi:MAG: histidine ammonia-lyase [Bacteroidota bacterium]|nr:histidine ammonia-lyase [Bacteroidota bacterium]
MFKISTRPFDFQTIYNLILNQNSVDISEDSISKIKECRAYLERKIVDSKAPIYGINTGFGALCNVKVSNENLKKLQANLVRSHACGTGALVPQSVIKLMLLLKIKALCFGHSGVQLKTVQRLVDFYNSDILPVVYTQGSLGASGDLAPLAHIALALIGEGEVWFQGIKQPTSKVLKEKGWAPVKLQSKEGLALLNGTQFMTAYALQSLLKSYRLSYVSDLIAALSLDAYNCQMQPFSPLIHAVRPHKGQIKTASQISKFLKGSRLMAQKKSHVQDPYSFRCIPQVHGATKDSLEYIAKTVLTEINSINDNPVIFVEADAIISGGNFHGQPLAFALDHLKISMAELGSISERRIFKLISGERDLPSFLIDKPGLNSGLMIPQYTAASIVSANKQLAAPASVDSIVSSNGQEDHVSMGANAAVQAFEIVDNVEQILAIELMNASQALFYRKEKTSPFLQNFLKAFRDKVPKVSEDRILHEDMQNALSFLKSLKLESELFL